MTSWRSSVYALINPALSRIYVAYALILFSLPNCSLNNYHLLYSGIHSFLHKLHLLFLFTVWSSRCLQEKASFSCSIGTLYRSFCHERNSIVRRYKLEFDLLADWSNHLIITLLPWIFINRPFFKNKIFLNFDVLLLFIPGFNRKHKHILFYWAQVAFVLSNLADQLYLFHMSFRLCYIQFIFCNAFGLMWYRSQL